MNCAAMLGRRCDCGAGHRTMLMVMKRPPLLGPAEAPGGWPDAESCFELRPAIWGYEMGEADGPIRPSLESTHHER